MMDHFHVSRWTDGALWIIEVIGPRFHPRTGARAGIEALACKRLED